MPVSAEKGEQPKHGELCFKKGWEGRVSTRQGLGKGGHNKKGAGAQIDPKKT